MLVLVPLVLITWVYTFTRFFNPAQAQEKAIEMKSEPEKASIKREVLALDYRDPFDGCPGIREKDSKQKTNKNKVQRGEAGKYSNNYQKEYIKTQKELQIQKEKHLGEKCEIRIRKQKYSFLSADGRVKLIVEPEN